MTRLVAISGSLRAGSSNTALLEAAVRLAPAGVEIAVYRQLGELPAFNPDLDTEAPPPAVLHFRSELQKSQGVIISTPEYAHGVPGVLKNALDWLVASGEIYEKPVALFNASARGVFAQASLGETLNVMTAKIISAASITVELLGKGLDSMGISSDSKISATIRSAISQFAQAIDAGSAHEEIRPEPPLIKKSTLSAENAPANFITGIFETHLHVKNLDRSAEFYEKVLGLAPAMKESARRVGFYWAGPRQDTMLGLWENPPWIAEENKTVQPIAQHLAFQVAATDLIRMIASAKDRGIELRNFFDQVTSVPSVFGWMPAASIYFNDPDGHLLEFIAALPAKAKPELGVVSLEEWNTSETQPVIVTR